MKLAIGLLLALQAFSFAGTLEFRDLVKEQNAAIDATTVITDFEFTNKTDKVVSSLRRIPPALA